MKKTRRDYAADVGSYFCGFKAVSLVRDWRPRLVLQCPQGHTFTRIAWDAVNATKIQCPECRPQRVRVDEEAQPQEVCDCTYFNGRLVRPCSHHMEKKAS